MGFLKFVNNLLTIPTAQRRYAQMLQKMPEDEEGAKRFLIEQRRKMSNEDWQMFASTLRAWRALSMKEGDASRVRLFGWLAEVAERLE